ncbi:hypothetical protein HN803_05475 [candidate division WWE3 bacterium]|jgi:hypothetical protein|nr:hypothetical protein [candidate division WWE3 bacterium]MBT7350213.1 hypothetical protein [candidate division WWE3 bacterium]
MKSLQDILEKKNITSNTRNKYEFQAYGNRLAEEFSDLKHRSLYIKLAKTEERSLLEQAREFVVGQRNINTPGKLFMWKLKELKSEKAASLKEENK